MPATAIATLSKPELFARLAEGLAGGVAVVTPNRRLAQALAREFDAGAAAQGRSAWESADILPYSAFVERCFEDLLYSESASGLPLVLTPAQELALWEDVIRRSDAGEALLALAETAALAADAWKTAHAWRLLDSLRSAQLNQDAIAFRDWCAQYTQRCVRDGYTDSALLPDFVAAHANDSAMRKPKRLVLYGFDIMTSQQRSLFAALQTAGAEVVACAPQGRNAIVLRLACTDARDEIQRAAAWARVRLEAAPHARIGIVVPDLSKHRCALLRALRTVMAPASMLPRASGAQGGSSAPLPFNVSLGAALTSYPLVQAACLILELAGREIDFGRASLLIRSPFIAAGETEAAGRARIDLELRRRAEPAISLERLLATVDAIAAAGAGAYAPELAQRLRKLAEFRKSDLFAARAPSAWARAIIEALKLMGFPDKGRSLDSAEYQTLKKWHEVVAAFAGLDRVHAKLGYGEAVARLRRLAAETLFQPEAPDAPVQILGVLESAGMAFDHLWVMGLTDDAWPIHPRPNPFLPLEAQRKAGVPEASTEATFALDAAITRGWLGAAGEVVLSHAEAEGERKLLPSPLLRDLARGTLALPAYARHRDLIHAAASIEAIEDAVAPTLAASAALTGGASVITDQSACPFRAFARHRLAAKSPEAPHAGLDAMERGILVHRVLAGAWGQLKTKAALDAIGEGELQALLAQAADEAVTRVKRDRPATLAGRFAEIEKGRLVRLARAWLEMEREARGDDFSVAAVEDKRSMVIGPLTLRGKLDRVDELDDGRRIVIDYKSSAAPASAWLGERPDEPQLPLYLVATEPDAVAIAFAQVKAGEMKFAALAADETLLPVRKSLPEPGWDAQVAEWRRVLARLATQFAAGEAAVQPKNPRTTCRNCDVQPLCRIHERLGAGVLEREGGDEG
ncbi:MAG: PD-(D/E)XK nuclease family protein [Burkholderiales bacterium]|nr:PD-(D/E)XK nuclease family protein [Burkholderiales bacterium]